MLLRAYSTIKNKFVIVDHAELDKSVGKWLHTSTTSWLASKQLYFNFRLSVVVAIACRHFHRARRVAVIEKPEFALEFRSIFMAAVILIDLYFGCHTTIFGIDHYRPIFYSCSRVANSFFEL